MSEAGQAHSPGAHGGSGVKWSNVSYSHRSEDLEDLRRNLAFIF